jgi:hypothetical protein
VFSDTDAEGYNTLEARFDRGHDEGNHRKLIKRLRGLWHRAK